MARNRGSVLMLLFDLPIWIYWEVSTMPLGAEKEGRVRSLLRKCVNTLRPRQDRRHFADDIFKWIVFDENCCILIKFSLKYVRKGPIDNNPALVQIMAWRRSGDKPLSEPMMISLSTHIHPSPKVMADFFQTKKLTWCRYPICTIFGGCIKRMQVFIFCAKYIDFLH